MGIGIKRGYETLPNNDVMFGVRVTNDSDLVISDVQVILDHNESLFSLQGDRIQKLDNIPPTIPRTAKFILKPLGCVHKENIEATISYRDHKWEKHMVSMRPKEVHCVCPFLRAKPTTRKEFLNLTEKGHSIETGMNFEGIGAEEIISFLMQTCSTRLYIVDNYPVNEGNIIYFSGESIGEKAYYLLTVLVKENEGLTQIMCRAVSDKTHGIHGFLNEIVFELKHLVNTVNSAKEIGIIRNEQVINIIDSVVQRTNFSTGPGSGSVNIQDSVVQRSEIRPGPPSIPAAAAVPAENEVVDQKYDAYMEEIKTRKKDEERRKTVASGSDPGDPKSSKKKLLMPLMLVFAAFLAGYLLDSTLFIDGSGDDNTIYPSTQASIVASTQTTQGEAPSMYIKYIYGNRAKNSASDMSDTIDLLWVKVGLNSGSVPIDMTGMRIFVSDGTNTNELVYAGSDDSFGTMTEYSPKNLRRLLTTSGNAENYFTAEVVHDSDSSFSQTKPIMNAGDHIAALVSTSSDSAASGGYYKLRGIDVSSGLERSGLDIGPGTTVSIIIKGETGTLVSTEIVTPSSYGTEETIYLYP
ncbi:hypothetical protein [Methanolobus sp. WCC4]|uniref:hypothetical protein n=1 Tax=Methanolobus sp. WCC4 TaxID=3125784 RepID=UPI0030FCA018